MQKIHVLFLILIAFIFTTEIKAQITPERTGKISYQGKLEQDGKVYTGNMNVTFVIKRWTETQTVRVNKGLYAATLGAINPIPDTLFKNYKELELEIYVAGQKLEPSVKINPVPFAYKALNAERNSIGSEEIQDRSIQARDLAPNAVNSINIASGSITGTHIAPNSISIDRLMGESPNRMIMTNANNQPFWADFNAVATGVFSANVPLGQAQVWVGNPQNYAKPVFLQGDIAMNENGFVTVLRSPQSNTVFFGGGGTTTTTVQASLTNGSVTNPILADNSVTTNKILDNTILPQDLAFATQNAVMTTNILGQPQWLSNSAFASLFGGWNTTGNATTNPAINFIGTTDNQPLIFKVNNIVSGKLDDANANAFWGTNAGVNNTGNNNTLIGRGAGQGSIGGLSNTYIGSLAGFANTGGNTNTFVGVQAGEISGTGSQNTYLGTGAGKDATGSSNVFLGFQAGQNETGSQKLYIENSSSPNPLIYGDFANNFVSVNGSFALGFSTAGEGMMAFNTGGFYGYVGTNWHKFATVGGSGDNLGSHTATQDIVLGTNRIGQIAGATGLSFDGSNNGTFGAGLTVMGNSVFSGNINFSPAFKFEGNTINGTTTNLAIEEPTVARTITLPNASGTVVLSEPNGNTFVTGNLRVGFNATPLANGMISYQTDNFYGYSGGKWNQFVTVNDFQTAILQGGNSFNTAVVIGSNNQRLLFKANNQLAGRIDIGSGINNANAFYGYQAGEGNTGEGNTFTGYHAGRNNIAGNNNVFLGTEAGFTNTTGNSNVFLGTSAGYTNNGSANIMIGFWAGLGNNNTNNVMIGSNAGQNNTGQYNVFLGNEAGRNEITGSNKLYIDNSNEVNPLIYGDFTNNFVSVNGSLAIGFSTVGTYVPFNGNLAFNTGNFYGYSGGKWNKFVTANDFQTAILQGGNSFSTAVEIGSNDNFPLVFKVNNQQAGLIRGGTDTDSFYGYQAGQANLTSGISGNVGIGFWALQQNISSIGNTAVGYKSLNATTGGSNTAVGYSAMERNTTGSSNTAVGYSAMERNTTGGSNTAVGVGALYNNLVGNNNTALGYNALYSVIGSGNIGIGHSAGQNTNSGTNNVFVGNNAGFTNTTGGSNTFVGTGAGLNNNASNNTFVGTNAGNNNTSGNDNTFVGSGAGNGNNTGINNAFFGVSAGIVNSSGQANTFLGNSAGTSATTGSNNVMSGYQAGRSLTVSNENVVIGSEAAGQYLGGTNITGTTAIGYRSGYSLLTGADENTFLGLLAGTATTSGDGNTFIGSSAGAANTIGQTNVFVGQIAGSANTIGGGNIAIGAGAGKTNTTGSSSTFIGVDAGINFQVINNSVFIGQQAGGGSAAPLATPRSGNVFIGYRAGYNETAPDRLHIANNESKSLITGNFSLNKLGLGDWAGNGNTMFATVHIKGTGVGDPSSSQNTHVVLLENLDNSSANTNGLAINLYNNAGTGAHNYITFYQNGAPRGAIEQLSGVNTIALKTDGADYAEYLFKLFSSEKFEKGDIVGIKGGKITKNLVDVEQYKVISTAPIVLGNWQNGKETDMEKVAFLGQVPVKVFGKVKAGDYIIPSGKHDGSGVAVSPSKINATQYQTIIGLAWENSENEGLKPINMSLGLNQPEKQVGILWEKINELQTEKAELKNRVESLEQRLQRLERLLEDKAKKE